MRQYRQGYLPQAQNWRTQENYEASFIVLKGNPIEDFRAVQHVSADVKQGHILTLDSITPAGATP